MSAAPQSVVARSVNATQFSLETLLLVTTLAAICLGLIGASRTIGLVVAIWSAAALVRTVVVARHHLGQGLKFALPDKVGSFVISLGIVVGAIVISMAALTAVLGIGSIVLLCLEFALPQWAVGQGVHTVVMGAIVCGAMAAGIAAGVDYLWLTRPR